MTGLQLLASLLMSFFIPGLGQMYQATYDTARRDRAVYILAALGLCGLFVVTWVFLPLVWIVSMIDCVIYAMAQGGAPAPSSRTAVALLVLAALYCGGVANAQQAPDLPNDLPPCWHYDMKSNTFSQIVPSDDGSAAITMTWRPQGAYDATPSDPEPCCVCTKDKPCNHAGCKHGIRCKCCKKPAIGTSACSSSACASGACDLGRRANDRTIGGRRFFFRRGGRGGGCRACR